MSDWRRKAKKELFDDPEHEDLTEKRLPANTTASLKITKL
jgi:hypothetical protein